MAQYNGYRTVPHASYDEWRATTWGNGYNVDYLYGNQCWDFCALLYWQYGLTLITKPGGGSAYECWTVSRNANSRPPFISLENKESIKRGDIIVWNRNNVHRNGHIAFADENYDPNKNSIKAYGQNQGQGSSGPANVVEMSLNGFLGIFRNEEWIAPPVPPSTPSKKKKFPWAVAWNNWPHFKQ